MFSDAKQDWNKMISCIKQENVSVIKADKNIKYLLFLFVIANNAMTHFASLLKVKRQLFKSSIPPLYNLIGPTQTPIKRRWVSIHTRLFSAYTLNL